MQLTIDIDQHLIERLKKEFHTTNIKEALAHLFEFYKTSQAIEIVQEDEADYRLIQEAKKRRQAGEQCDTLESVLREFQ